LEQMQAFRPEQLREWSADFDRRLASARTRSIPIGRWARGWRLAANGDEMETGVSSALGRSPVLITHPVSRRVPAAIERKLRVPTRQPRLLLTVTSFPEQAEADWELRVSVNGKLVEKRTVHSPTRWEEMSIDLAPYAGREVTLRLENAAGGARPWSWEAAYWARAEVVGG
jgi:hypothetical protein